MPQPSRLLVNTGPGKGKSSAAFGVMGRAWARGWTVGVVQFVKSDKWQVGERKLAAHLGVDWHTLGDGFTWESEDLDATEARGRHAWQVASEMVASGDYDLVILDEMTYIVKYGWVPVADVVAVLASRPQRAPTSWWSKGSWASSTAPPTAPRHRRPRWPSASTPR